MRPLAVGAMIVGLPVLLVAALWTGLVAYYWMAFGPSWPMTTIRTTLRFEVPPRDWYDLKQILGEFAEREELLAINRAHHLPFRTVGWETSADTPQPNFDFLMFSDLERDGRVEIHVHNQWQVEGIRLEVRAERPSGQIDPIASRLGARLRERWPDIHAPVPRPETVRSFDGLSAEAYAKPRHSEIHERGEERIEVLEEGTIYHFTTAALPAHPGVVKLTRTLTGHGTEQRVEAWCFGTGPAAAACSDWRDAVVARAGKDGRPVAQRP